MAQNLEDILGGVVEEIRRAEERLKLDSFRRSASQGDSAPSTKRGLGSFSRRADDSRFDPEPSRGPVQQESGWGTFDAKSMSEAIFPTSGRTLRREREDLESESQSVIDDAAGRTLRLGSSNPASPRGQRTALVNRLLQERDARLRASRDSAADCVMPQHRDAGRTGFGLNNALDYQPARAARLDGCGPSPKDSPETSGKIFFASDVVDKCDNVAGRVQENGSLDLRDLATGTFGHVAGAEIADKIMPQQQGTGRHASKSNSQIGTTASHSRVHHRASSAGPPRERSVADPAEENVHVDADVHHPYSGVGGQHQGLRTNRRIAELARDRQHTYSERERRRREILEAEETKECTFHPKLATPATAREEQGINSHVGASTRLPLHERLHKEAREREAARALAQHHLEAELLRECTFQPALTSATGLDLVGQKPLFQRVWEVERRREHKLRVLQADKEEREGATFAPQPLGKISQRLARDAKAEVSFVTPARKGMGVGLQMEIRLANERRRQRLREHEEVEARMSTFEPSISRGTERLVRKRPELQAPFEERRAVLEARKRERDHLRLAARAEEERLWFNPATTKRTEHLLRRRMPQRLDETVEERVARMAAVDDRRRREYVERQRAKEESECTFRPALNQVTQSIGQAAPLDELVHNRRGQRVRERAHEKARNADVCTHKPALLAERAMSGNRQQQLNGTHGMPHGLPGDLNGCTEATMKTGGGAGDGRRRGKGAVALLYGPDNKYRLNVRQPGRMTADLRAREREHGAKVRALREEREVEEMQMCTFTPRTNETILRAQGSVVVRGLGRHLELKDVAQQQEMERKIREEQAFGVRKGAVRRTALGETVLEPFSLSEGNKKGWWEERKRRHEAENAAQCTFKPRTVESERSKALSRLLDWSSVLSSSAEGGGRGGSIGTVESMSIEAPSS